ncbi:hypothetical protein KAI87_10880 [Myxococcota bacterium]|nr:hypothetical protein [Myxococcota bacterium]
MTDTTKSTPDFDIENIFKRSGELFMKDIVTYILAMLVITLISIVTLGIAAAPLYAGFIKMIDRANDGEEISVGQVFDGFSLFLPTFVAAILIGIAVFIGSILFVIPGIIAAVVLVYSFWFIAIEGASATDAMSSSFKFTKDNPGPVLIALVLNIVLAVVGGMIPFGFLVTSPFAVIFLTVTFNVLRGEKALAKSEEA